MEMEFGACIALGGVLVTLKTKAVKYLRPIPPLEHESQVEPTSSSGVEDSSRYFEQFTAFLHSIFNHSSFIYSPCRSRLELSPTYTIINPFSESTGNQSR
jgi:hypothetical protein